MIYCGHDIYPENFHRSVFTWFVYSILLSFFLSFAYTFVMYGDLVKLDALAYASVKCVSYERKSDRQMLFLLIFKYAITRKIIGS